MTVSVKIVKTGISNEGVISNECQYLMKVS